MKLSYNWLKELVPALTATPEEVAQKLTMHAYETEVLGSFAIDPAIRVVKIEKIEPHPHGDRLRLATVTDGTETIRVVCGAPNIAAEQVVPYAPPGAKVYDNDGQLFTIKEATIRGEKSPGMLASARELGLSSDHAGIFVLPPDTPLGSPLAEHIGSDTILETDITPNRAHDSFSHLGVAREVAALYELSVEEPKRAELPAVVAEFDGWHVAVEDAADTPRYAAVVVNGARAAASPLWLQARLLVCGLRPLGAIVDITNYVLLEQGQPSHAFDQDKLAGKMMGVRRARGQEKLMLIDGQALTIPPGALVITSNDTPVALAGIMGGAGSEVGEATSDLLVEVANFRPYAISHTAAALAIRTEASVRFAKGISPSAVEPAAGRLIQLFVDLTGATAAGIIEQYPAPVTPIVIDFMPTRVSRVGGTPVAEEQVRHVLERLRFGVDAATSPWHVTVPLDRLDVRGEHDVVEEVIRITGLETIPSVPVSPPPTFPEQPPASHWREVIRDVLVEHGFTETYNLAFEPSSLAALLEVKGQRIELLNPLAPEQKYLRTSLLPGLVANFITNKDDFHTKFQGRTKALFEIGHVYQASGAAAARVPGVQEEERVAGLLVGTKENTTAVVEALLERLGVVGDEYVLCHEELPAGVTAKMKYRLPVAAFELNATALYKRASQPSSVPRTLQDLAEETKRASLTTQYREFSRYPSVLRDVSFLVHASVTVEQAQELLERVGGELVVDTELFDEFLPSEALTKEGAPPLKGLAFHLEYQALNRTLTTPEIDEIHNRIIGALQAELGAQIR